MTVVTCAVPSVLPEIQSTGVACEATVTTPMPGTSSFTGLQCQEISDEVPQLVGLKHQVRHGLVRRLERYVQRHRAHARNVGNVCEGRRVRVRLSKSLINPSSENLYSRTSAPDSPGANLASTPQKLVPLSNLSALSYLNEYRQSYLVLYPVLKNRSPRITPIPTS